MNEGEDNQANEGEGNRTADRDYRAHVREFIRTDMRGKVADLKSLAAEIFRLFKDAAREAVAVARRAAADRRHMHSHK